MSLGHVLPFGHCPGVGSPEPSPLVCVESPEFGIGYGEVFQNLNLNLNLLWMVAHQMSNLGWNDQHRPEVEVA